MTKTTAKTRRSDTEPYNFAKNKVKKRVEMLYCVRDLLQRFFSFCTIPTYIIIVLL
ncbi:hypothetical protein HMPREF1991_01354 [Hoylesella loescheii DSM 19665 = JCM 12249 = ATCC 15930]|uniref:Uncharacterized protein n=1 Tax=Hoylesella loescheii DSM 19665 = JCM 12249 = ATCC 15930 TaxID=1122985 RepID=A0A069QKJ1_HOYLO|nr:hypothetical protein HMPREF1991_01354 [Hoylesella loescheii DSM 19665 = JCM 12249 = ATCC 15930]